MNMTSKQRAFLIKLSHDLQANCQIGKSGVVDGNLQQISEMLSKSELIKVNVLPSLDVDLKGLAYEIAEAVQAQVVIVIGRKIVFYRRSQELAKKGKSLVLPR